MEKWYVAAKRADFNAWAAKFHISPVTARILRNRDVTDESEVQSFLYGTLADCHSPWLLKDMEKAVEEILTAIEAGMSVRVIGDYDVDGICSAYILTKTLQILGAKADTAIPHRIYDGYGLNDNLIEEARRDGIGMIVTCDNGIAAASQIAHANSYGIKVIVTDHHEVPRDETGREQPPPADAVVNPKQEACGYPFPEICGGVVAYKLVQVLYEQFHVPEEEWENMLEFAAIATVGDVMRLQDENRLIVRWGLKKMARTNSLGLKKLVEACGLDMENLTAYHIGFVIGPCLNASGRLQTAKLALELLLCEDEAEAARMAEELRELNEERKTMTQEGVDEALLQVEEQYKDDSVLVIFLPDCHESVAGIIAGRVREAWNRPVFVLTRGEGCVKGSGRSIEAYHMYREMCKVSELFLKFGGHPMAAGFSIEERHVDELRRRLNEQATLGPEDFIPKIWIDVAMPLEYISESLIRELKLLEPFGQGNEKPQFAWKNLHIRSVRVLGKNRNAVKLTLVTEQGLAMDGMLFAEGDRFMEELGEQRTMDVVYYPDVNEYNGRKSLQIVIRAYKLHVTVHGAGKTG